MASEVVSNANELDSDADTYVTCTKDSSTVWKGTTTVAYGDCDDNDIATYPTAIEACDASFNNCTHPANPLFTSAVTDASGNELAVYRAHDDNCFYLDSTCIFDADGDGVIDVDSSGQQSAIGQDGSACDINIADVNANGQADDCETGDFPSVGGVYTGVVATCFCDANCENCADTDGNVCAPTASDVCVPNLLGTTLSFGTSTNTNTYEMARVDCLCPTSDCAYDSSGDGVGDCFTPDGQSCESIASVNTDTLFEDCITTDAAVSMASFFRDDNNNQEVSPFSELDKDDDNVVECTEFDQAVYRAGGGSFLVTGGSDCDDNDAYVYPLADAICDGQYNDCEHGSYSNTGSNEILDTPEGEYDNDGDGWVDCAIGEGPWAGYSEPFPFYDELKASGEIDLDFATNIYFQEWSDSTADHRYYFLDSRLVRMRSCCHILRAIHCSDFSSQVCENPLLFSLCSIVS